MAMSHIHIVPYIHTSNVLVEPLEPNLPAKVLTKKSFYHPLSFGYMYLQKPFPPVLTLPVLLPREVIIRQPPSTRAEIFRDLKRMPDGELKLINKDIIESQSGIFGEVVKRAMKVIFTGQGLVAMSLPVKIFEPRSTMQRIADNMCYIPTYMKLANDTKDPVERAKYCITSFISGLCMSPSMRKPFNPYLGETMEAVYSDGSKLYMEHTSHHPPISNFFIDTVYGATIWGRYEQVASMSTNSMEIIYRGPFHVRFSDGSKVTMFFPTGVQNGIIFGDRHLKFEKKACYIDEVNKIKGYAEIGVKVESGKYAGKRADTLAGEIYTYEPSKHKGYGENYKDVYDAFRGKDRVKKISSIAGSIYDGMEFDGVEYWNFENQQVERAVPIDNPLPSDYRFREDLIWMEYNNKDQAQEWKLKLEEIQRWDRSLRQEAEKKRNKKK